MLFSIVVALMVILVTAFWTYQGFFNALMMFLISVVACMAAFSFYEPLNGVWADSLGDGVGQPLALMLIFLAVLLLLRLATDKVIGRTVTLPVYVDRTGGGVCGFFTGLILVGMALVGIQMLPIGSTVLGFERVSMEQGQIKEADFAFKPDRFTVGLATMLSNGRFGGDQPMSRVKPDLLVELYSGRANPQPEERVFLPPDALAVSRYWFTGEIDNVSQRAEGDQLVREFTTVQAPPSKRYCVCSVRVDAGASVKDSLEIRFRAPQFHIVGPPPASSPSGSTPQVYLACGLSDIYTHKGHGWTSVREGQSARLVRFDPQTDFILGKEQSGPFAETRGQGEQAFVTGYRFEVAFEVPQDFSPWYVEFKRGARAELTKKMELLEPPDDAAVAGGRGAESVAKSPASEAPTVGAAVGGNVHVADAVEERTGVFAALPIPLDRDEPMVARSLTGGKLADCHFFLDLPANPPTEGSITEYSVPDDKRMVQIGAEKKDALSLFGRALNYAANVAAQIRITDDQGTDYFAVGVYSIAPVGGKMVMEIQYHPETEVPERCLEKPKKLTASILGSAPQGQRRFGYVFLVTPGVKIVSFSAGARQGSSQPLNIDVPE